MLIARAAGEPDTTSWMQRRQPFQVAFPWATAVGRHALRGRNGLGWMRIL